MVGCLVKKMTKMGGAQPAARAYTGVSVLQNHTFVMYGGVSYSIYNDVRVLSMGEGKLEWTQVMKDEERNDL